MIELTHRPTINEFLRHPDNSDFWKDHPEKPELPGFFMFLYECGCMMIVEPLGNNGCGIHMACLKSARGKNAVNFAKRCFNFIKQETNSRIFARIQANRREVMVMAKLSGMKEFNRDETHAFLEVA